MNQDKLNLIFHPVRLRILSIMSGQEMTSQQVAGFLSDVPVATLYRHINTLYEGGLLTITEERPIRGTVEKVYKIADEESLTLTEEELQNATKEDHAHFFTTFLFSLLADFTHYLRSKEELNLEDDGVGYNTVPIYMSNEELMTFTQQIQTLLQPYMTPQEGRKRRKLSSIIMPAEEGKE